MADAQVHTGNQARDETAPCGRGVAWRPRGRRRRRVRRAARSKGREAGGRRSPRARARHRDRPDAARPERTPGTRPGPQTEGDGRPSMKVVIVGGVAGGASCAARLLVANEAVFLGNFGIDVRKDTEAIPVSPRRRTVELEDLETGMVTVESADERPGRPRRRGRRRGQGPRDGPAGSRRAHRPRRPPGPDRRGRDQRARAPYRGTQGRSIIGPSCGAAAWTGVCGKPLGRSGFRTTRRRTCSRRRTPDNGPVRRCSG